MTTPPYPTEEIAEDGTLLVEEELSQVPPTVAPPLGDASVRGAFWTVLATAIIKIISLVSQIALAWFLVPKDMGLLAFAFSITSVAELVTCGGLIQVMVQRSTPIEQESSQVFWLSLTMHVIAALVVMAFAPLAGIIFKDQRVVPLIIVIGLSWPLGSLSAVYQIKILRELQFKTMAGIQLMNGLIKAVSSVVFAALSFGAYSLVLPVYLCYIASFIVTRRASGPLPIGKPHPGKWLVLLSPALWLTVQSLSAAIQSYGTGFVIGSILRDPVITGLYYWGFTLSGQAVFLVVISLKGVLFPALARLNGEPQRQYEGFQRALRLLNLVAIPLGLLQAITAEPIIQLFFHPRWYGAAPVVQYLSLGLITQPMQLMTWSLLLARGKFRFLTIISAIQGISIILAGIIGAAFGTPTAIAICVGAALFSNGLFSGWAAERSFGKGWLAVLDTFRPIAVPVVASGLLSWGCYLWLRPNGTLVTLIVSSMVLLGSFTGLVLKFAPCEVVELLRRLRLERLTQRVQSISKAPC